MLFFLIGFYFDSDAFFTRDGDFFLLDDGGFFGKSGDLPYLIEPNTGWTFFFNYISIFVLGTTVISFDFIVDPNDESGSLFFTSALPKVRDEFLEFALLPSLIPLRLGTSFLFDFEEGLSR